MFFPIPYMPMPDCSSAPPGNPVLVEVTRGDAIESGHRGAAAVCDAAGELVAAWGDIERPVFPRSAIKPLQAIPLVETGAADAFDLSEAELALTCASHSGEPGHVQIASAWLARIGLGVASLACGTHEPIDGAAAAALLRAGAEPTPAHNNCSGKHAAMLTTALHMGEAVAGYELAEHPVQRRVRRVVEEMGEVELSDAAAGLDGCSIPTIATPLVALARAMARLADPRGLAPARAAACARIRRAMAAHPFMVAGTGRCDTALMTLAGERIIAKTGAEGVYCAALPRLGLGLALKIDDGAKRAAEAALLALLRTLGALDEAEYAGLAEFARPPVLTRRGARAGEVRPAAALAAPARAL